MFRGECRAKSTGVRSLARLRVRLHGPISASGIESAGESARLWNAVVSRKGVLRQSDARRHPRLFLPFGTPIAIHFFERCAEVLKLMVDSSDRTADLLQLGKDEKH